MSLGDMETFLDKEGREVLRQLLQAHLDRRAEAKRRRRCSEPTA